ncbi:MAG: 16S rRNA (cytosine(1402)-N(4))-methyltransferase RsmH [Anaerolineales bacterium]|jgi:16S rRNA (cytosine1402-N4)-methyltransferase
MHEPVLYQEIIHYLRPHSSGDYVDGTVGAGGHAKGILEASAPDGRLIGLDLDPQALELARTKLDPFSDRVWLVRASFATLDIQLGHSGWDRVDGILLDLGISSIQLRNPERGFSFQFDGPLDMRFDPKSDVRASDLVNELSEKELANLLYRYGEERKSRKIARAIVNSRPINTTRQLAIVVSKATRGGYSKIHPATRTFQALRIAVNKELESLETVLPVAIESLKSGGRLAVISFHSLEDRLVKNYYRRESRDCICPSEQPICDCEHKASIRVITPKPVRPRESEIQINPRSRSARLRVAERVLYNH